MRPDGLPSRTSIVTAAARALGSREPDASVRNPDWAADRLIGPAELTLIADHPISKALDQDFQEAMNDPEVFGFVWLMLVRTRFIDEQMERAIRDGATQVVILGAGFDTRAHRFTELLKGATVIEIDYRATQDYKRRRVDEALGGTPANVVYAPIDFAREGLGDVLRRAGFQADRKTYYIAEGLSMYVPEEGMKETLRAIAAQSAPGSVLLLEYLNRGGLELLQKYPSGMIRTAIDWGEPFVFGVPDGQDREFFLESGLELGEAMKVGGPESVKRYAMRGDGTYYGAHLEQVFRQRSEAALKAMDDAGRQQAAQAAKTSGYWLAEMAVPASDCRSRATLRSPTPNSPTPNSQSPNSQPPKVPTPNSQLPTPNSQLPKSQLAQAPMPRETRNADTIVSGRRGSRTRPPRSRPARWDRQSTPGAMPHWH
jgi:methyltransferase (TIGR00027 family)